jgi:hypothetical protein
VSLKGKLEHLALPDLLRYLRMSARTGTLEIRAEEGRAWLGIYQGALISASADGAVKLGELLLAEGALTKEHLELALEVQSLETEPRSLGAILIEAGMPPAALYRAVQRQIMAIVSRTLRWKSGSFQLIVGDPRRCDELAQGPGDLVPGVHMDAETVVLDCMRVSDEQTRPD